MFNHIACSKIRLCKTADTYFTLTMKGILKYILKIENYLIDDIKRHTKLDILCHRFTQINFKISENVCYRAPKNWGIRISKKPAVKI